MASKMQQKSLRQRDRACSRRHVVKRSEEILDSFGMAWEGYVQPHLPLGAPKGRFELASAFLFIHGEFVNLYLFLSREHYTSINHKVKRLKTRSLSTY